MARRTLKARIGRRIYRRFPIVWLECMFKYKKSHFEPELWLVPLFCSNAKTAIDIGANMGVYSYYMQKFAANVVSFEPNSDLWVNLRRVLGKQARIESAALSDATSKAVMRIDISNTGVSTIENTNDLPGVEDKSAVIERTVETRTLDSYCFSDVSLIKIDVEGHEEAVIEGAVNTILQNQPVMIIESENRNNSGAPRRLHAKLADIGYSSFYLRQGQLFDFNTLTEEEMAQQNPDNGRDKYINNFIFIPEQQKDLPARIREFLKQKNF